MEVYVNECSIHGQYHDQASFDAAFQKFYQTLDALQKAQVNAQTYQREGWMTVYQAIKTTPFVASLNAMKQKDLRTAFFRIMKDGLKAKDWQQEQIHSWEDTYSCNGEDVKNTSVAEAAERVALAAEELHLLLNFPDSKFAGLLLVEVVKNETVVTEIDCVDQHTELEQWFESKFQLSRYTFDFESNEYPRDEQTVLTDEARFTRTNFTPFHGSTIYKENKTSYYWYVDTYHKGRSAHLEVFDATGFHVGEASLDGTIDRSKRDPNKRLRL